MRTTLAEARLTRIPDVLLMCPDDVRFAGYLNEAVLRLLPRGQWRGTVVRYQACLTAGCLTWPRQIETILAWALGGGPGIIRSHWYEFLGFGPGLFTSCSNALGTSWSFGGEPCGSGGQLVDRGLAVTFDDICGTNKTIRAYVDYPADEGAVLLLQGWDTNGNWILTQGGDVNGEKLAMSLPWAQSLKTWRALVGVQKPITQGPVRLYEYDTVTGSQRLLAVYEPDETLPEYRRSMIPSVGCCPGATTTGECHQNVVTVLAKLKFVPVRAETDYLLIANTAALKDMCMSIKKREDNLIAEAAAYEQSAVAELERELSNFHGDGTSDPVATMNSHAQMGIESML